MALKADQNFAKPTQSVEHQTLNLVEARNKRLCSSFNNKKINELKWKRGYKGEFGGRNCSQKYEEKRQMKTNFKLDSFI
jgi:hypothetical protein